MKETLNPQGYKILFFDTETTGLLNTDARLVQLSWILADGPAKENILSKGDYIIQPDGFKIPRSASDIHGITTQRAEKEGIPLYQALAIFFDDLSESDYYVCHNVAFDYEVIRRECERLMKKDQLKRYPSICTMASTTYRLKIPKARGFKYPRLEELHKFLFGRGFVGAHDSANDIQATYDCFWECLRRKWFSHPTLDIKFRRFMRKFGL